MQRRIDVHIPPQWEGRPIRWVAKGPLRISTRMLNHLKRLEQGILVDGQRQFVSYVLHTGQVLSLLWEEDISSSVEPVPGPVDIIYEDDDILVVNKPPHMAVHPSAGNHSTTLANHLAAYYQAQGQMFVPRIITRLDKNTSGLVLLARHGLSAGILGEDIQTGAIQKQYTAIVCGKLPQTKGIIDLPIRRKEGSVLLREVCHADDPNGKPACTRYAVITYDKTQHLNLVHVWPLTGRTHQIRVHMAAIGCPLLGDFLYGTEEPERISRHALHMSQLTLTHPITRQSLCFSSPLPDDMSRLFELHSK